ncbi:hypothetical protein B296_00001402 [Ensete ventricosum]|uniref:Argonaute linker 1 domain-containing protein n=1 Tax=Ensete ventricosum TaxID=4639 RepID=A0A427AMS1_ENSVE|nr:hypothetical protein B296_00001402 [Ensete ventricosum]
MLADVGREGACVPSSPSPHAAVMPSRQMTKEIKGVKPVVSKKQPLNNSMNQQKLENGCLPHDIKNVRRRRGRGRTKAVEREVKQEVEVRLETVAPPVSSKGVVFCRRPGFGQAGTRCIVKANHFLAELPDKDLNQYDVSVTITPEVSSRSTNRAIIAEFVRLYRETELGMRLPAYDGRKSLYTAGSLPFNSKEFTIKLLEEDGGITRKPQRLGDGLQSWCGFYQSIRPTQMGLSLNIDMSCTAFIDPLPVVEFVAQILGKDVSSRPLSDADRIKLVKCIHKILDGVSEGQFYQVLLYELDAIRKQGSYSPIPRGPVGGIASASPPLLFAEHCDGDSSQISPYTFTSVGIAISIGVSVLGAAW